MKKASQLSALSCRRRNVLKLAYAVERWLRLLVVGQSSAALMIAVGADRGNADNDHRKQNGFPYRITGCASRSPGARTRTARSSTKRRRLDFAFETLTVPVPPSHPRVSVTDAWSAAGRVTVALHYLDKRRPLWVISGHRLTSASCPLFPSKRTFISAICTSA